jgi:predicted Zn-dependent protease
LTGERALALLALLWSAAVPVSAQSSGLEELLERSRAAIEAGHYHPVQVALSQALRQRPEEPRLALLLVEALHRDGQAAAALPLAESLVDARPGPAALSAHLRVLLSLGYTDRAQAVLERLRALEDGGGWSAVLGALLGLASGSAERCVAGTAAAATDPDAEQLRAELRGLCLLLDGPEALAVYLSAGATQARRPATLLTRYASGLGSAPALAEALAVLPPELHADPWVWQVRMGVAELRGDRPARDAALRALREAQPEAPEWKVRLARDDFESYRYDECVDQLRTWFATEPMPYPAALMAGRALASLERCDEAVPMLDAYLATDPLNPDGNAALGDCLARLENAEAAEAAYRRALELRPAHRAAVVGLASLLRRGGRDAEARALLGEFESAQREARRRQRPVRALRLARAAAEEQRWEEAERYAREAVALDPQRVDAHAMLATAALQRGDRAGARGALARILEVEPENRRIRSDLAALARADGDRERAQALLEEQLARFPASGDALESLVALDRERGELERALARVRSVSEARPRDPLAARLEAELLHDLERFEEGLAAALRAVELAPGEAALWQRLLVLAEKAGDAEAARRARAELERLSR